MWKQAVSFPGYEVSDSGEVRNVNTKHVLSQQVNNRGYSKVFLVDKGHQNGVLVHRLVASAFCENDDPIRKTQVNHINEDKTDNRSLNLEWVTPSENVNHGTGISRRAAKRSKPIVMTYKGLSVVFDSAHDAEKRTFIPAKSIQKCCTGRLKSTHGASFAYLGDKVVG